MADIVVLNSEPSAKYKKVWTFTHAQKFAQNHKILFIDHSQNEPSKECDLTEGDMHFLRGLVCVHLSWMP